MVISKGRWLTTGRKIMDSSRADFTRIIELTEKNQNVKERATIYAMIGDQYYKSGMKDSAHINLNKAIELDPENANFIIQKGDMEVKENITTRLSSITTRQWRWEGMMLTCTRSVQVQG